MAHQGALIWFRKILPTIAAIATALCTSLNSSFIIWPTYTLGMGKFFHMVKLDLRPLSRSHDQYQVFFKYTHLSSRFKKLFTAGDCHIPYIKISSWLDFGSDPMEIKRFITIFIPCSNKGNISNIYMHNELLQQYYQ